MGDKIKNVLSEEKVNQIRESLKDASQLVQDPSIIKDNKIIFYYKDKAYRVCMPNQRQSSEANHIKHQLYGELIQTEGCYLKNRLKEILQEKQGIDIKGMEIEFAKALQEYHDAQIDLALIPIEHKQKRVEQVKKVIELEEKYRMTSTPLIEYLSHSIEDRCQDKYVRYLTSLCTEKLVNAEKETWKRVWNTFEEFQNDASSMSDLAINRLVRLLTNIRDL